MAGQRIQITTDFRNLTTKISDVETGLPIVDITAMTFEFGAGGYTAVTLTRLLRDENGQQRRDAAGVGLTYQQRGEVLLAHMANGEIVRDEPVSILGYVETVE